MAGALCGTSAPGCSGSVCPLLRRSPVEDASGCSLEPGGRQRVGILILALHQASQRLPGFMERKPSFHPHLSSGCPAPVSNSVSGITTSNTAARWTASAALRPNALFLPFLVVLGARELPREVDTLQILRMFNLILFSFLENVFPVRKNYGK